MAVERDAVERDAGFREAVERFAVEREPVERLVLREDPELFLVARVALEEELDLVSAPRSLSKSLSAALLVLTAVLRSAVSLAVTSL